MAERRTHEQDARDSAAAGEGDEAAFTELTRRHRRELHVHCYRMLASFDDAEDLVQETFLRAWQKRDTFQGRGSFRAWLYRIATNACLDLLARDERRVLEISARGGGSTAVVPHVPWLQPYPDRLLEPVAPDESAPDALAVRREAIELAFIVALQHLPPKQRAVLILREVLDCSASETATLLASTVPAVNGALQRARATLKRLQPGWDAAGPRGGDAEVQRRLVQAYVDATERCDTETLMNLLSADARFTMPPAPLAHVGNREIVSSWVEGGFGSPPFDEFKCLVTWANGMPAVANYVRREGSAHHEAFALDVLRIEGDRIAEVTAFEMGDLSAFGLPNRYDG